MLVVMIYGLGVSDIDHAHPDAKPSIIEAFRAGCITIFKNIRQTGWWFIPVIGIWGVTYAMNTLSYMLIVRDGTPECKNAKFPTLYKVTLTTFAMNSVTPAGLVGGEPYKIMELKQYWGVNKATSSVILFAMMHFLSHFFFWIFCILAAIATFIENNWMGELVISLMVCFFFIFLFFKGHRKGITMHTLNWIAKIPFLKKKINAFITKEHDNLKIIDTQIASLHGENKMKFYGSLAIEFLARIVSCAEIYFIALALGHPISYMNCILIIGFTTLFSNMLFFSPLQLGIKEGGFKIIFRILKIQPIEFGFIISIITRIRELFWLLVGMLLIKVTIKDGSIKLIDKKTERENFLPES